jgi:hypothetical protein
LNLGVFNSAWHAANAPIAGEDNHRRGAIICLTGANTFHALNGHEPSGVPVLDVHDMSERILDAASSQALIGSRAGGIVRPFGAAQEHCGG